MVQDYITSHMHAVSTHTHNACMLTQYLILKSLLQVYHCLSQALQLWKEKQMLTQRKAEAVVKTSSLTFS